MERINLSHDKSPGSLILKGNNTIQSVEDNGIRNYRWVDGQHDFQPKFPKNNINTHLREQYKIGDGDFKKNGFKNNKTNKSTNTKSGKDTLHEILAFKDMNIHDSGLPITVTFPDANTDTPGTFKHTLPTVLGNIKLENIGTTTIDTQIGDILVNIIGHKEKFMEKAPEIKTFLGIDTDTYSKDVTNTSSYIFQTIFKKNGELGKAFSYFSEILDPAKEKKVMKPDNVQLTLLYCYIQGNPVYITLKKKSEGTDVHSNQNRTWYYAFHTDKNEAITQSKYVEVDLGVDKNGSHNAPTIHNATVFIKDFIEGKKVAATISKAVGIFDRMKNKAKESMFGNDKLTKKEAQNVKKFISFDNFYKSLLTNFYKHTRLRHNNEISKTVILSFKTIGDQMYLYDAILLSALEANNIDQSWVITTDTFLRDYIIYTKSANVISLTKYDNKQGMRKMAVYLKPRKALSKEEKAAREAAAIASAEAEEKKYIDKTKENKANMPVVPDEITPKYNISLLMNNINNATPLNDTRRNDKFKIEGSSDVDGFHIILLYYAILTYKLAIIESTILKEAIDIESSYLNTFFAEFEQNSTIEMKDKLTVEQQKMYIHSIETNIQTYKNTVEIINSGNTSKNWMDFTTKIINLIVFNAFDNVFDNLSDKKNNLIRASIIVNNLNQIFKRGPTQYIKEFSFFMSERKTIEYNLTKIFGYQSGGEPDYSKSGAYLNESQLGEYYYKELQKEIEGLIGSEPVQSEVSDVHIVGYEGGDIIGPKLQIETINTDIPMVEDDNDDIIAPVAKNEDKTMEAKFIKFIEQKLDAEEEIDTKETTTEPVPPTIFNIPTDESEDMKIDIDNINIDEDLYHITILYNRFLEMSDKDFDDYKPTKKVEVGKHINVIGNDEKVEDKIVGKRKHINVIGNDDDGYNVKKPKAGVFNFGQHQPIPVAGGKKKNKRKTLKKRNKTKKSSLKKGRKTQRQQIKRKHQTKKAKKSKN